MQYAIVQHSGYVRTAHHELARAVETVSVTPALARQVVTAGGLVFGDYGTAEAAAEAINYPPEVTGLLPGARGHFHALMAIDGLPLYVPSTEDTQRGDTDAVPAL